MHDLPFLSGAVEIIGPLAMGVRADIDAPPASRRLQPRRHGIKIIDHPTQMFDAEIGIGIAGRRSVIPMCGS